MICTQAKTVMSIGAVMEVGKVGITADGTASIEMI
jgi:hypothetical protein